MFLIYYIFVSNCLAVNNRKQRTIMLKKLDILGLELDNYTVREAMFNVETYLNNDVMNTVETISMRMIEQAGGDEVMHNCLQELDLAVIGEKEILTAAGAASTQRIRETVENEFFLEFMKRLIRNKKTVYLLGQTADAVERLYSFLQDEYEKVKIVGQYAMETCIGDLDAVVNAINMETPDVIFSVLPSPYQEHFLEDNRGKLSARVWYGLGEHYAADEKGHSPLCWMRRIIRRKKLTNRMNEYNNNEK